MHQADKYVSQFGEKLKRQYGFLADPSLPLWQNIDNIVGDLSHQFILSTPTNMACHNYLPSHLPMLPGTENLLGLGFNYCIKSHKIKTTTNTFERLREEVRRKYPFSLCPPDDNNNYIPGLYIKSDYKFKPASDDIEAALTSFQSSVDKYQSVLNDKASIVPNLTPRQFSLMKTFKCHDDYIFIPSDKGLGPVVAWRTMYGRRVCSEHLGNTRNYREITPQMAKTLQQGLRKDLKVR